MKLIDVSVPLDSDAPDLSGQHAVHARAHQADRPRRQLERLDAAPERARRHPRRRAAAFLRRRRRHRSAAARDADAAAPASSRCTTRNGITAEDLAALDLSEDVRVLIKTHNSRLWGSPEFHTRLRRRHRAGARYLVEHGVKVVGVDYLSVEEFKKPGAPAHHVLLGAARSSSRAEPARRRAGHLRDVLPAAARRRLRRRAGARRAAQELTRHVGAARRQPRHRARRRRRRAAVSR